MLGHRNPAVMRVSTLTFARDIARDIADESARVRAWRG